MSVPCAPREPRSTLMGRVVSASTSPGYLSNTKGARGKESRGFPCFVPSLYSRRRTRAAQQASSLLWCRMAAVTRRATEVFSEKKWAAKYKRKGGGRRAYPRVALHIYVRSRSAPHSDTGWTGKRRERFLILSTASMPRRRKRSEPKHTNRRAGRHEKKREKAV